MLPGFAKEIKDSKYTTTISLSLEHNSGKRYEDTYGEYLKLFEWIAWKSKNEAITVHRAPWCWAPLLTYLDCQVRNCFYFFEHCEFVRGSMLTNRKLDRTTVEVLCGFRPECVDALWKLDMQWTTSPRRHQENRQDFIVTNNGSFHRNEVQKYLHVLSRFVPEKRNVVLVPCAADKPYPSPLHEKVLSILPRTYYLMNATGVLGLVPRDLWDVMPYYDSGIPNEWRLMNVVMDYFSRVKHENIVVYCDFYSLAIHRGLVLSGVEDYANVKYVNPIKFYYDYLDLLDEGRLAKLQEALS